MVDPLVSDESLAERLKCGCRASFEELYLRYKMRIYNFILYMTNDRSLTEECTQDTFIRLYQKISFYRPTGTFSSWLYQMAKNITLDSLKRKKVRRSISLDEPSGGGEDKRTVADTLQNPGPGPAILASASERAELIRQAIAKLAEKDRQVILLSDMQGFSHEEAAGIMGVPPKKIALILFRARKRLAKELAGLGLLS